MNNELQSKRGQRKGKNNKNKKWKKEGKLGVTNGKSKVSDMTEK